MLIILKFCIGTGRLLFSYQLPIYNPKLWFVYCLSSHLTAHKPEHKSWGKAMTASGNWKIKPKKRSLQCPNDENSWAGLEINRLKAAYPKILVCMKYKAALSWRGWQESWQSLLKIELRVFSNGKKQLFDFRFRSNGNVVFIVVPFQMW